LKGQIKKIVNDMSK